MNVNKMAWVRLASIFCCLIYVDCFAKQTERQQQQQLVVAVAGANVSLSCSVFNLSNRVQDAVRWEYNTAANSGSAHTTLVLKGKRNNPRCPHCLRSSVTSSREESDRLNDVVDDTNYTIVDVQPSQAGIYICSLARDDRTRTEHELQVLAAEPRCHLNFTDESNPERLHVDEFVVVRLQCDVRYSGNWQPMFECLPEVELVQQLRNASDSHQGATSYVGLFNVTRRLHAKRIECAMRFKRTLSSSKSVTSANNSHFVWRSPPFEVAPDCRGSTVSRVANTLNCTVESRLQLTSVEWIDARSGSNSSSNIDSTVLTVVNSSVLDVCQTYGALHWDWNAEPQSYSFSFDCVARFDDQYITIGNVNFLVNSSEEMNKICPRPTNIILGNDLLDTTMTAESTTAAFIDLAESAVVNTTAADATTASELEPPIDDLEKPLASLQGNLGVKLSRETDSLSPRKHFFLFIVVLPLVSVLVICGVVLTVLIHRERRFRRLKTKRMKPVVPRNKNESCGPNATGLPGHDDLPEMAVAPVESNVYSTLDRITRECHDELATVYETLTLSSMDAAVIDKAEGSASHADDKTKEYPWPALPYLSLIADDDDIGVALFVGNGPPICRGERSSGACLQTVTETDASLESYPDHDDYLTPCVVVDSCRLNVDSNGEFPNGGTEPTSFMNNGKAPDNYGSCSTDGNSDLYSKVHKKFAAAK